MITAEQIQARLVVIAADSMGHPLSYGHFIRRTMQEVAAPLLEEAERLAEARRALRFMDVAGVQTALGGAE